MSTVLAVIVALAFFWSVILFFGAIVLRERDQERGFGWALAGAVVFFIVFIDRLPSHSTGPRDLIKLLPGVDDGQELFASSVVALGVLAIVYAFRIAVFYRLLLKEGVDLNGDGRIDPDSELVNDIVAPALSYFCFAICVVSLLQPAYGLSLVATVLVAVALFALYYGRLWRWLREFGAIAEIVWTRIKIVLTRAVVWVVQIIARGELLRTDGNSEGLSVWVSGQLANIEAARTEARRSEQKVYAKIAGDARRGKRGRRR